MLTDKEITKLKPSRKGKQSKQSTADPENDTSCTICYEKFNKSNRKQLKCPYCSDVNCLQCAKRYVATSSQDPHCMHCKVSWNMNFIKDSFPTSWLSKEYKELREKLLFDTELSKIPDTQKYCDAAKERNQCLIDKEKMITDLSCIKAELERVEHEYEECNQDIWLNSGKEDSTIEELKSRSHDLYLIRKSLYSKIQHLDDDIDNVSRHIKVLQGIIIDDTALENHEQYHIACPKQDCKGFVNKAWVCKLCKCNICDKCHEIKQRDIDHKCDPLVLANVETVKMDTKPCPKCSVHIHKIDGCDQMWCTQCKTAFSWNTGRIEDVVHNPHYYEWLQSQNAEENHNGENLLERNNERDPCRGNFVTGNNTFTLVNRIRFKIIDKRERELVMNIVRLLVHISEVEIPNSIPNHSKAVPHDPNRELRISYMLNEITQDAFRKALQKREKERLKKEEFAQILQMFSQVADDMLWKLLTTPNNEYTTREFFEEFEKLRLYTNESLMRMSKQFGGKPRQIPDDCTDLIILDP